MSISMYRSSVPVCQQFLTALAGVLRKAEAHASESGLDPAELLDARLAPDMLSLSRQVQLATDHAKGMAARLSGRGNPSFPDTETTFAELQARIAGVMDFISSVEVAEIEGSEERAISLKTGQRTLEFTGHHYLLHFALPNFFFHVATAYAILRSKGVPLGKRDFMGAS